MDGPGEYYAKWNKPVRERQIPHDLMNVRNLMNKINWWSKQNQKYEYREQTDGRQRGQE